MGVESKDVKPPTPSEGIHPGQKIRSENQFKFVFKNGFFVRGKHLNIWVYQEKKQPAAENLPKFGVVVGRKTHTLASVRNVWKRRIREAFRKQQNEIRPGVLILIQSKAGREKAASYQEIKSDLSAAFEKAKIKKP